MEIGLWVTVETGFEIGFLDFNYFSISVPVVVSMESGGDMAWIGWGWFCLSVVWISGWFYGLILVFRWWLSFSFVMVVGTLGLLWWCYDEFGGFGLFGFVVIFLGVILEWVCWDFVVFILGQASCWFWYRFN